MEFFSLSPTVRIESPRKGNVPAPITIINRGLPAKNSSKTENCFGLGFFLCRGSLARKLYVSGVTQLISGLKRLQNTSFIILIFFSLVFAKPSRV